MKECDAAFHRAGRVVQPAPGAAIPRFARGHLAVCTNYHHVAPLLLPTLDNRSRWRHDEISELRRFVGRSRRPTVAFHLVDRWDGDDPWSRQARDISEAADLVLGHQLPARWEGRGRPVPILLPATQKRTSDVEQDIDLFFAGAFWREEQPLPQGGEIRTREARGSIVSALEKRYGQRFVVRQIFPPSQLTELRRYRRTYIDAMNRARLAIVLPGFGYNTLRLSEALLWGLAVVTPAIDHTIRLPESSTGRFCDAVATFSLDGSDIFQRIDDLLAEPDEVARLRESGTAYGRRWATPASISASVSDAVALLTGS